MSIAPACSGGVTATARPLTSRLWCVDAQCGVDSSADGIRVTGAPIIHINVVANIEDKNTHHELLCLPLSFTIVACMVEMVPMSLPFSEGIFLPLASLPGACCAARRKRDQVMLQQKEIWQDRVPERWRFRVWLPVCAVVRMDNRCGEVGDT